ncbi:hypothetical protein, partial [Streptomyces sp. SP17KL33]|uniref:hypothetical protein n=1 Tax=Streptomyces sp. SP17KL33 TaxID=3002534 RepID=UPI002E7711A4
GGGGGLFVLGLVAGVLLGCVLLLFGCVFLLVFWWGCGGFCLLVFGCCFPFCFFFVFFCFFVWFGCVGVLGCVVVGGGGGGLVVVCRLPRGEIVFFFFM